MRTSETLLLDFIRQSPQFRIPVNQRRYAWTRRHCRQLWDDILDAGERQDVREHFLGPIMYVAAVDPLNAHWAPLMVYDGQQRLTTITLILKTLSRHLKDHAVPDGFGPDQIRSEYLVNPFGKGDQHYRLVLKAGDAETLLALVHDRPLPTEPSARITDAHAFFETRIKQLGPDVSPLCAGLRKLRIVAFQLKEGEDNPHRIFETMNTCGRDLTCWRPTTDRTAESSPGSCPEVNRQALFSAGTDSPSPADKSQWLERREAHERSCFPALARGAAWFLRLGYLCHGRSLPGCRR